MVKNTFLYKNNSIRKNSELNTGKNPVGVLHYGNNDYGRFIFTLDLMGLYKEYKANNFNLGNDQITHILKMTNTSFFNYNRQSSEYKHFNRAESFSLILYRIDESFDEGTGYDQDYTRLTSGKNKFSNIASNYYYRTATFRWSEYGGIDTSGILSLDIYGDEVDIVYKEGYNNFITNRIVSIQNFPEGNENLSMDVTDFINEKLTLMRVADDNNDIQGMQAYSDTATLCLAFLPQNENDKRESEYYVGFFSRHSHSAYSPYLQTSSNTPIKDDRDSVFPNKVNHLYYYNYVNGVLKNAVNKPIVYIVDDPDGPITENDDNIRYTLGGDLIKNPKEGVYSFEFMMDGLGDNCSVFYDVWTGTNMVNDIEVQFKNYDSFNLIDEPMEILHPYEGKVVLYTTGIMMNEQITRGNVKTIKIKPRIKYSSSLNDKISNFSYRIYTKEGMTEIPFTEYVGLDMESDGTRSFRLDSESYLPNDYFVDIKIETGTETIIKKEHSKFRVVSTSLSSPMVDVKNKGFKPKFR